MPAFEIIAIGFDGSTDVTDDRVLWVWCKTEQWLRDSLKGVYYEKMNGLDADFALDPDDYDFIMPKDVQALHNRLTALAGVPLLSQVECGEEYMLYERRVMFIAPDPDDGAYLICKFWDEETDEQAYVGCEASDLRFLPPEV